MNKNYLVDFEIAKLLKEKGFDEKCKQYYSQALFEGTNADWEGVFPKFSVFLCSGFHFNSKENTNNLWFEYSAPNIFKVIVWLYEKYEIWISVFPYNDEELSQTLWENKIIQIKDNYNDCGDYTFYHSPIECYEAAIKYCLENLL